MNQWQRRSDLLLQSVQCCKNVSFAYHVTMQKSGILSPYIPYGMVQEISGKGDPIC